MIVCNSLRFGTQCSLPRFYSTVDDFSRTTFLLNKKIAHYTKLKDEKQVNAILLEMKEQNIVLNNVRNRKV
jgi:hypothetical protein